MPHKKTGVYCNNCSEFDACKTHILIAKLDATGDVLRTAGIIPALKTKYPSAYITWVTSPTAVPLLELVPGIDRIWPNDGHLWSRLLTEKFDLVFGLDCSKDCASLIFLSTSKKKLGFSLNESSHLQPLTPPAQLWFEMGLWDDLKRSNRLTYQEILWQICELPPPTLSPALNLPQSLISQADEFAFNVNLNSDTPVIGLFTGTGKRWPQKSLSVAKQKELLQILTQKYQESSVVLFGGPSEETQHVALLKDAAPNIVSAGCHNSLAAFAALVNLVDVLITPDTLALHVALALKKQVVAYFGPTSPWEIDLFGYGEKVVAPVDCVCCYRSDCSRVPNCAELISVDNIIDALERTLKVYEPA